MSKKPNGRRTPAPRAPDQLAVTIPQGEPPRQLDTTAILWQVHERLTRMETKQDAMAEKLDDLESVQREQAQSLSHLAEVQEQSAVENERAHGEMKTEFSALGVEVAGLVADKRTPPSGASAGRKGSFEGWAKTMEALKTYTPWLYGLGVLLAGVIGALLSKKGSAAGP